MANQQQPSRPWFRLPSIARPVIDPTPAPAPAQAPPPPTVAPSAPVARPTFRSGNQTQEPTPPTSVVPKSPPKQGGGATSVPTSPANRPNTTSSLPTSPIAPTTTLVAPVVTTSSLPSSPKPRVSAPTSSLPTSPASRATTQANPSSPTPKVSGPTSPIPKSVSTTFSAPTASPRTAPPPNPIATSPIRTTATTNNVAPAIAGAARSSPPTTTVKPRTFQTTPPDSPKPKPTAPPPSPLILPPAKIKPDAEIPLEAEQKRVLVQKTISTDHNKPKPRTNGNQSEKDSGKKETPKDHTQAKDQKIHHKKMNSESEKGGMRVITIAGENKGAYMEVIRTPDKKTQVFEGISHNLKKNSGSSSSSYCSSSEEEEERQKKNMEKGQNGKKKKSSGFMSTFMNSNVQGVNNSIVYNSSCSHHDPGVHLALSRKPANGTGKDHRSNGN